MYQINRLHALNLHNVIYQLYVSKAGGKEDYQVLVKRLMNEAEMAASVHVCLYSEYVFQAYLYSYLIISLISKLPD